MNTLSSIKSNTFNRQRNSIQLTLSYDTIDPSGLTLYYPFTITTLNADAIRVGNMATGTIVYDASLTDISTINENRLSAYHTGALPTGRHGLVINRTLSVPTGGMCISFWFIATSIPRSDYWFIYTVQDTLGYGGGTRFYITLDTVNKIRVAGPGNTEIISNTVVVVGTRYHLLYNYTAGGSGSLYINGVVDKTQATNAPVIVANNSGRNSILRDPAGNGLIGNIDEVRHYINTSLNTSQIATLYSIPPVSVLSQTTLVGVTATDTIQLYDVNNSLIVPLYNAKLGIQYRLITTYTSAPDSIARYLQFNTPDYYGLWVNAYNASTNPTGYPTTGNTTIGGLQYVIWPYTFTLTYGGSFNFYLYGLTNSNTTPFNPTTQYALINISS